MTDDRTDQKVPRASDPDSRTANREPRTTDSGPRTSDHRSRTPDPGPRTPDAVPILDLRRQYLSIRSEIDDAVHAVLDSGEFILGPHVARFEEDVARYYGVQHAIGLASGTDALLLALRALGIGPGDGVLVPSFTFFATAGVVHNVGATPVFCDIDPKTYNIDPASARAVLAAHAQVNPTNSMNSTTTDHGPRTADLTFKAIIPVHLYGQMADMDEILALAREYDLVVIEDAAQAIGAQYRSRLSRPKKPCEPNGLKEPNEPVTSGPRTTNRAPRTAGSLGALGCFSFYPTKNLGAYGDAGLVTTNDDALAETLRLLRVHGAKPKYFHRMVGINSRLDALQAAILSVKLRHLDSWTAARQRVADRYDEQLAGIPGIVTPHRAADRTHIFHQYTVRVTGGRRDALAAHLKAAGIGTMIYYPGPLHRQDCFAHLGYREGDVPESERASREVLSLPIFPELTKAEQDLVVAAIKQFAMRSA